MSFFGFGQGAEIDVVLDGTEIRKMAEIKSEDGKKERHLLYYDGETVSGKVNVTLKKTGSRLEHQGIKIEFIGQIELYYDRGNHHEFTSLVKELARPGELTNHVSYPFEFLNVEKPFESYTGSNVRLRYFLRVTIVRRLSDIVREVDLVVHTLSSYPDMNNSIKMEVGIEECLHIEFEYNKSKYHLKDVIVGKIYFLLVRIKIKHMEIAIIRRETTGSGPNMYTENETIAKYEIMDGAPVRGESIPIRVFLAGYDLTPTMRDINKKFSVRYFLNLVLMDEEDRRYFKQQEITLWRKGEKTARKAIQQNLTARFGSVSLGDGKSNSGGGDNRQNVEDVGKEDGGVVVVGGGGDAGNRHVNAMTREDEESGGEEGFKKGLPGGGEEAFKKGLSGGGEEAFKKGLSEGGEDAFKKSLSGGGEEGFKKGLSGGGEEGFKKGLSGGGEDGFKKGLSGGEEGFKKGLSGGEEGFKKGLSGGEEGFKKGLSGGEEGFKKGLSGGEDGFKKGLSGGE